MSIGPAGPVPEVTDLSIVDGVAAFLCAIVGDVVKRVAKLPVNEYFWHSSDVMFGHGKDGSVDGNLTVLAMCGC
jgi:hypothetical protein